MPLRTPQLYASLPAEARWSQDGLARVPRCAPNCEPQPAPASLSSFACGGATASGDGPCVEAVGAARRALAEEGHGRLGAPAWAGRLGVPLSAFADTIDALGEAGYPPVFLLLYDQPWQLVRLTRGERRRATLGLEARRGALARHASRGGAGE